MSVAEVTIRPGEMRVDGSGTPVRVTPATNEPTTQSIASHVDPWTARLTTLADHVMTRAEKSSASGGGNRILWVVVVVLYGAFGAHLVSDGSLRTKVDRTERLVEWLVKRAMAEDAGEKPPPYPVL